MVVGILLAAAVWAYHTVPSLPRTPPSAAPEGSASSAAPAGEDAAGGTGASAPGSAAGAAPATGPGITEPGVHLVLRPLADGSFDVAEYIRLAEPTDTLALAPPAVAEAGGDFAELQPQATAVQISAGDQPVTVPGRGVVQAPVSVPVRGVTHVEMRYVLQGVVVRSVPSTAGRAIGAVGPLTSGLDPTLPVLVTTSGATVLGLSCPLLELTQRACGQPDLPGRAPTMALAEPLPYDDALFTVQFDIPRM